MRRSRRLPCCLASLTIGGAILGALAPPAGAAQDDLILVSRASDIPLPPELGAPGNGASTKPAISADGSSVAFVSGADNLAGDDDNAADNIFVRRPGIIGRVRVTTLASRSSSGVAANGSSDDPAISADGRFVAFTSSATNLSGDDVDGDDDVFVRDLIAGTTTLVSRASAAAGGAGGDKGSFSPSISADGRFVAFDSGANNLSSEDAEVVADVFVRDLFLQTTTLASRASAGPAGDGFSQYPSISADGRFVAFTSAAANLSDEDADGMVVDVFIRDLVLKTTTLVSRSSAGPAGDGSSAGAAISADGRAVAFESDADNLSDADDDAYRDVFIRDLAANTTTLVSRGSGPAGPGGDGGSLGASISADGRLVAFASFADNLLAPDPDGGADVFVRDLATSATRRVSRAAGPAGAPGDRDSSDPSVSGGGTLVAFDSTADNIFDGDGDFKDVFLRDLGPLPPATGASGGSGAAGPGTPGRRLGGLGVPGSARCAGRRAAIVGTAGRNVIRGTRRADVIAALGGNDVVRGRGGDDLICLGPGSDRAEGGPGADRILGGPGADRILGGPGADRLIGGPGRDVALGGAGRDHCSGARLLACERSRE